LLFGDKLGKSGCEEKKMEYKKSNVLIMKSAAEFSEHSCELVETLQLEMVRLATAAWRLPD
jgi:hypothetical protein